MSELQDEADELTRQQELAGGIPTPLREITDVDADPTDGFGEEGESLGDGAFISPEPMKIYRKADGSIFRTVPLSEVEEAEERFVTDGNLDEASPLLANPSITPTPLNRQQRHTLIEVMAIRLLEDYGKKPRELNSYNPVYDGIPYDVVPGTPQSLQPGTATLYPASQIEILEWFKRIIGARAEFINKDRFGAGYKTDVVNTLRIHREPIQST